MKKRTKIIGISAGVAILLFGIVGIGLSLRGQRPSVKVNLPGVDETVYVLQGKDGRPVFELRDGNNRETLSPDQFGLLVVQRQATQTWWQRMLNISSPSGLLWVLLGFGGQILFSGRMLVQWVASEKKRRSVVPVAFWWLALGGASMLLVYFIWRKDIIGILGQATGWLIYTRNLYFIYRVHPQTDVAG